jgi:hypothetical protein
MQPFDWLKSRPARCRLGTAPTKTARYRAGLPSMFRREEIYRAAVILLAALILSV